LRALRLWEGAASNPFNPDCRLGVIAIDGIEIPAGYRDGHLISVKPERRLIGFWRSIRTTISLLKAARFGPAPKAVAEANGCVSHMLEVLRAARKAKIRVFYAMHRRYRPGDYETWQYVACRS
jgi:hypothetical protein